MRLVHKQRAVLGANAGQTIDQTWVGDVKCAVVPPRQEHAYHQVGGLEPVQLVAAVNQRWMRLAWRIQEMIVAWITDVPAAILWDPERADEAVTGYIPRRRQ
jgi:hypothetical protein